MKYYAFEIAFVLAILALCVLAWPRGVQSGEPADRTLLGYYTLSNGQNVTWWLDEPRGLLCEVYERSLSCVPLTQTTYAQEVK